MYINFKEFEKSNLSTDELVTLCALKQNNTTYLEANSDTLEQLEYEGLVKEIKGFKKLSKYEKVRISDEGKKLLEKLEGIEVSEDTEIIFNWLSDYYKGLGKEVGNASKTKRWIEHFAQKSGIKRNNLVKLCKAFVSDENNMEYSHRLEYIVFKPKTVYQTKFSLEDSRLFQFYMKSKKHFDEKIFSEE